MPRHKDGGNVQQKPKQREQADGTARGNQETASHTRVHNWLHRHYNLLLQAKVERDR